MKKKKLVGHIKKMPSNKIYLNVNLLEKGIYNLKIVHKNKIIKSTHFIKE
jgi:hypothetical protein